MASSKSRACSPSIVTTMRSRKSVRPSRSAAGRSAPMRSASATRLWPVLVGDGVLAQDDLGIDAGLVDARRAPRPPRRAAAGPRAPCRVISTTTIWPGSASPASLRGMQHIVAWRGGRTARRTPVRGGRARSGRRACCSGGSRLVGRARRAAAREGVEMTADQHQRAVVEQLRAGRVWRRRARGAGCAAGG